MVDKVKEYFIKGKSAWPLGPWVLEELPGVKGRKWVADFRPDGLAITLVSRSTKRPTRLRRKDIRAIRGALAAIFRDPDKFSRFSTKEGPSVRRALSGSADWPCGVVTELVYRCGRKTYRHRFRPGAGPWLTHAPKSGGLTLAGGEYRWDPQKGIVDLEPSKE